jgi:tRNA (cytidine/uridine-2'-O-)-methyltransferase
MGFEMNDAKLKRAGLDYWKYMDITFYKSIDEFFEKNSGGRFYFFTSKGKTIHSDAKYEDNCFLVFGREDAGINEQILFDNKDTCVRMPMETGIRCLNLSNAVAIGVYEVLRQWGYPQLTTGGELTKFNWEDAK